MIEMLVEAGTNVNGVGEERKPRPSKQRSARAILDLSNVFFDMARMLTHQEPKIGGQRRCKELQ